MKVVQVNTVCNTSTGKIMECIQREAIARGYETCSFVGRRKPFRDIPCEKTGNPISFWIHVALTTAFDRQGFGSWFHTCRMIKRIKEENPDIIHLHNLHGYYLNFPLLFHYLKEEYKGKVFWTFHDCWPITGHCVHFAYAGCERWKHQCYKCPMKKKYPISWFLDGSKRNFRIKKELFRSIRNLTVIVPSVWMETWVKESFLKDRTVCVVPNGIDLATFKYGCDEKVYHNYHIADEKKVLLGVASVWDERKGLQDFYKLAETIEQENYQIVLIGLSSLQIRHLPAGITGIMRTENKQELAALYSRADIFINPSREESFSLVTVEAMACGTPVIVLDTSAVKELVTPECGIVIDNTEVKSYVEAIKLVQNGHFLREEVRKCAEKYDQKIMAEKIVSLYEKGTLNKG